MAVTEVLRGLGSWAMNISPTIPDELWKRLDYFGHIVVHAGKNVNPAVAGDSLLRSSRYTGVLRGISESASQRSIGGLGMAMWLGDPDNKGDIIEEPLTVNGSFQTVINAAMAGFAAVQPGTIFNISKTFSGTFQFQTRREVIDYICQTVGAAWRVNGDATLDAGLEADLFTVNPRMVLMRKKGSVASYDDMFLRALSGNPETARDVEDLTTRVLLLAQGSNGQFASATADATPGVHPYLDMYGNPIKMTRIVQESETDAGNAEARAQLQLNRFLSTRDALGLSTSNYDIKGDAQVGDYIAVFDPSMGLLDYANEEIFRGERINPLYLKLTEVTWPITRGMSVCYRDYTGEWFDLTNYVSFETGETALVVGGYNRALGEGGSGPFPVVPPEVNTTVPAVVEWSLPFVQAMYQSEITGESRSEMELRWARPDNEDGTAITDGDHYEIRWRTGGLSILPLTFNDTANYTWNELNTWNQPIAYEQSEWQTVYVPWSDLAYRLQELTPGAPYDVQIRAVDNARPANVGMWSDIISFQTAIDILPPATPAPPVVAANPMAVQMTHYLGKASGGTFNLDRDLHHLELHGSHEPLYTPTDATLIGKVPANWGMITGQVPVVAGFQITSIAPEYFKVVAVDTAGNKSQPSTAVVQTAQLIADQYIQNLTVSKITAGTITSNWIISSYIRTAVTGARVSFSFAGIEGYNAANQKLLDWSSSTGVLSVIGSGGIKVSGGGNVEITDGALIIKNASGNKIVEIGECADNRHGIQVYKDNGVRVARIGELASGTEGIEVIDEVTGELVRVSTLAFGTVAHTISTPESTAVTSFTNLATVGPFVTVNIGNSGRAIVMISSGINAGAAGGASIGVDIAGPGGWFWGAGGNRTLSVEDGNWSLGKSFLVEGLVAGANTFQMKYMNGAGAGSALFYDRHIAVMPY